MYSVVLATAMAVSGGGTAWNCHGCHGCSGYAFGSCHGCWGGSFSISIGHGCCSGCYGCVGCYGCYGNCNGCSGCYGSYYGPAVVYAAPSYYYGSGCFGCYGGCYGVSSFPVTSTQPQVSTPAQSEIQQLRIQVEMLQKQLEMQKKKTEPAPTAAAPAHQATVAKVTVRLPADAKLFIDDISCPLTSETRSFDTPNLKPGQKYYYMVRAEVVRGGQKVQETQRVVLEAGQQVSVTFPTLSPMVVTRP
ncbi:MAG TPA: TIGR03000 domain-containing protein [Gemmataceae bacterium]|nr:TIGR03000 domain-containing protein [Gemmataceae bacterium]